MSIDVVSQVFIKSPRRTVAAFMFDPNNDAVWISGPVRRRRFGSAREKIEAHDDRFVEFRVTAPLPLRMRYDVAEDCGGTIVAIRARSDASVVFRLTEPLLARLVRRSIERDLRNLRRHLEAGRTLRRR